MTAHDHGSIARAQMLASVLTCQAGQGLDLYRIINKKLDPDNTFGEHAISEDVRRLVFMKCKDLNETRSRVLQFVPLCNEYCDNVGKEVDAEEKTFAV